MNIFLVSDTHFGHAGICKFLREDGTKLRPWDNVEEMDEYMVAQWNKVVQPKDKVYHIGDVVINRKALAILKELNGDKVLIRGNHDIFHDTDYRKYFRELRAYHVMHNLIFSHIPIHEGSIGRFKANVHGHLHHRRVTKAIVKDAEVTYSDTEIDPRYHCVCVEHTDYAPIAFDEVLKRIKEEQSQ